MRLPFLASLPLVLGMLLSCAAGSGDGATAGGESSGGGGNLGSGGSVSGTGGATTTGGTASGTGATSTGGAAIGTGGAAEPSCTPSSGTEDVGADSFLDKTTCLTWQKANTYSGVVANRDGDAHCRALVQDGFDDWRLPTAQELRTYPDLADAGYAYLAGPIYIPTNASSDAEGCTGNSHSCNLTQYSPGSFACAWQGPGANSYGVLCVRGDAGLPLDASFAVAVCCASSSSYKIVDCSAL